MHSLSQCLRAMRMYQRLWLSDTRLNIDCYLVGFDATCDSGLEDLEFRPPAVTYSRSRNRASVPKRNGLVVHTTVSL